MGGTGPGIPPPPSSPLLSVNAGGIGHIGPGTQWASVLSKGSEPVWVTERVGSRGGACVRRNGRKGGWRWRVGQVWTVGLGQFGQILEWTLGQLEGKD